MEPTEVKIQNKEAVTHAELQALRASVAGLPAERLASLKANLATYADTKKTELDANPDAKTELLAIQQVVEEERKKNLSPLAATGAAFGEKAGELADTGITKAKELSGIAMTEGEKLMDKTASNAKALAYREFAMMQDPNRSTKEKILRGLGIVALMYGAYRAAKWVVGKKNSGFLGRAFRFLGISALSVWAINYFGKDIQAKPAVPNNAPNVPAGNLLSQLPDKKTLIDGTMRTFMLQKKEHTLKFTHRSITLDNKEYKITSSGINLDISKAERNGGIFELEAGAFGQKGSIQAQDGELTNVISQLLATDTYESTTADGKTVTIARA